VAPIDSGTEHLGCLEWGVGFGRLLGYLRDKTHVEFSIFVDERTIPRGIAHTGSGSRATLDAELGTGLRSVASTNADLVRDVLRNEFLTTVTEEVYTKRVRFDVEYEVVALPLFDFAGRQIGVMAGVRSTAEARKELAAMATTFLAGTGAGVVLLAIVVFFVFDRLLRRPLETLRDSVEVFAGHGGDIDRPVTHLGRRDEFGTVSKNMNKLREKLVADARLAEEAETIVTTRRLRAADKETTIEGGADRP
jgi:methyl-accepting chemotaxis protein